MPGPVRNAGRSVDMLHGPLAGKILLFALPLAATGILQQLFNAADIAVVGQFAGKEAMAAVGTNAPLVGLFTTFFIGLSIGANVVIARLTGAGDTRRVHRAVHTTVLLALLCGLVVTALGELLAVPILSSLSVPDEILPMAIRYFRIYIAGMPVILLYNFQAAIFRSQGDTRTPLVCLTLSGLANVGLNLFFVIVLHMNVAGVALATALSNALNAGMLFVLLCRHPDETIRLRIGRHADQAPERALLHTDQTTESDALPPEQANASDILPSDQTPERTGHKFSPVILRPDPAILREIFRIGLPAGLQSTVFTLSNVMLQSAINSLGTDVVAASAAAFNIEIIVYYIVNSFGQACTTFVGQNYGAGRNDRCRLVVRRTLVLESIAAVCASALLYLFGRQLLSIFNADPLVVSTGMIRLRTVMLLQVINGIIEVFSGAMRGYGRSAVPALIALVGVCGLRIAWVFTVFPQHPTFQTIVLCYPISWAVTSAAILFAYLRMIRRIPPRGRS